MLVGARVLRGQDVVESEVVAVGERRVWIGHLPTLTERPSWLPQRRVRTGGSRSAREADDVPRAGGGPLSVVSDPADAGTFGCGRYDRPDMSEAGSDRVGGEVEAADEKSRRPDWFHRGHPVFFPLAGFFAGMVAVIVVPGLYAAIVKWVAGYKRAEELFPFVLLMFVVPIGLLVPQHTRRFGRYMLLGMVSTVVVVVSVGGAVAWFLLNKDA
ncbi:hypothetical protein GCM10022263_25560 [Nocardioides daeguensis]|uniref:Uncharacterized protein n=2 Tax=Nocardioides daeguensis TaxID=908359 RepID=A0ABP6VN19_9ACTN